MKRTTLTIVAIAALALGMGCAGKGTDNKASMDRVKAARATKEVGVEPATMEELEAKSLYQFTPEEVDRYLGYLQAKEPDLRKRIVHLGRKNLEQPYELYLLGEFPYEPYDPQPLFCIEKSDCVVFSEHTYAMALSRDWQSFFAMLQRIRYRNGEIGVASRNHYTEADWDKNNTWLVRDISAELGGASVVKFTQKVDRAKFLKGRYKIEREIPVENLEDIYIPVDKIPEVESQLQDGDYVNVMVGTTPAGAWATHVGLIAHGEDGVVHFLHSTPPKVREEPLAAYIKRSQERDAKKEPGEGEAARLQVPAPAGRPDREPEEDRRR